MSKSFRGCVESLSHQDFLQLMKDAQAHMARLLTLKGESPIDQESVDKLSRIRSWAEQERLIAQVTAKAQHDREDRLIEKALAQKALEQEELAKQARMLAERHAAEVRRNLAEAKHKAASDWNRRPTREARQQFCNFLAGVTQALVWNLRLEETRPELADHELECLWPVILGSPTKS